MLAWLCLIRGDGHTQSLPDCAIFLEAVEGELCKLVIITEALDP